MGKAPDLSNYVEVNVRIEAFYAKHPEGAIRTNIFSLDDNLVVVGAEVFRHRDDTSPTGTGFSQMQIPGKTPYTKNSELENAETSAVGRAIAMAGFEVRKSVASSDEIAMKSEDDEDESEIDRELRTLRVEVRSMAEADYGKDWKKALMGLGLSVTKADTQEQLLNARETLADRRAERTLDDSKDSEPTDDVPF